MIRNNKEYKDYSDFLNDSEFVRWRLTKNKELENYWNQYIQEKPELKDKIEEACSFFNKISFRKEKLTVQEKELLLHSIKESVSSAHNKNYKKRLLLFATTSVAIITFLLMLYSPFNYNIKQSKQEYAITINTSDLNSEEVQLITSTGTTYLKNNTNLQQQVGNTVLIQDEDSDDKIFELDRDNLNKLVVPYGKRSTLTLSDGTNIWLNSGSVLEFPAKFTGKKREIYLTGEIYADVAKAKIPFIIHTKDADVNVYGTKLNITAYENSESLVVLESGAVGVKLANEMELHLAPKEMLSFDENGSTTKASGVNVALFTSWKEGFIFLTNTSMYDVLQRIERYYNLSFNYSEEKHLDLKTRTCTGRIVLSENIDNVLTTFALLAGVRYEKENQRILIDVEP